MILNNPRFGFSDFCTNLPRVPHSITTSDDSYTEGSRMTYRCEEYFSFKDDVDRKEYTIECKYLIWRGLPVPNCISK